MSDYHPELYLTEKGMIVLKNRLVNLTIVFTKKKFPFHEKCLGFFDMYIENEGECLARMKELADITGVQFKLYSEHIVFDDGTSIQLTKAKITEEVI